LSDNLHALAAEFPRNSPKYQLDRKEAGWVTEMVWMLWRREKSHACAAYCSTISLYWLCHSSSLQLLAFNISWTPVA